jgi:hypothetical protein
MPDPNDVQRSVDSDIFQRGLKARIEIMQLTGEKLQEEYRCRVAEALLQAGLTIYPSQHLHDNEFVVSCKLYETIKNMTKCKEINPLRSF